MEWKKAKSILIFLFMIIDIFLLGYNFFSNPGYNVNYGELNSVLSKNNIKICENGSLKNRKNVYVYEFYSVDVSEKAKISLLGEYEKKDKNEFTSKNKNAVLTTNGNKLSYYNSNPDFDGFENISEKNAPKKLKPYLKLLDPEKYARLESVTATDGEYIVKYNFFVDGNCLFSSRLEFVVSDKGIHKIDAVLNIPDRKKGYKFELSGIETILMNFSQNSNFAEMTEITNITYGYYISEYENAVAYQALPVYMIKTKDKYFIYDARDGVDSSQRCLFASEKNQSER